MTCFKAKHMMSFVNIQFSLESNTFLKLLVEVFCMYTKLIKCVNPFLYTVNNYLFFFACSVLETSLLNFQVMIMNLFISQLCFTYFQAMIIDAGDFKILILPFLVDPFEMSLFMSQ